jgi:hypothetical protein
MPRNQDNELQVRRDVCLHRNSLMN